MDQKSENREDSMTVESVIEHFQISHTGGVLRSAANNADFDLRVSESERASQFLAAMARANVTSLKRFDQVVEKHAAALPQYFGRISDLARNAKRGRTLAAYSFLGELVLLLEYPDLFDVTYLTEAGWHKDIVELVLRAVQTTRGIE
ncbi:hypothetical protein [Burkholderia stagnalis]|uniref:hypothetical protein n=1 Tax=Burkholderia stagnalis TaxID=1503054 RepID=UPI0016272168|nr:hypothetical protein [Burkholderia stagnalis]